MTNKIQSSKSQKYFLLFGFELDFGLCHLDLRKKNTFDFFEDIPSFKSDPAFAY